MLIAVPSDTTDGLDSAISDHFGHCAAFTLVTLADDAIGEVSVLENEGHEEGGCMAPVNLLKARGVGVLLAGGMGGRAQGIFAENGIEVVVGAPAEPPESIVRSYLDGKLQSGENICDH